jgi:hypothetical protein
MNLREKQSLEDLWLEKIQQHRYVGVVALLGALDLVASQGNHGFGESAPRLPRIGDPARVPRRAAWVNSSYYCCGIPSPVVRLPL